MIPARRPVDHIPILVRMQYNIQWRTSGGGTQRHKWDYDKLAKCIQYGDQMAEFINALEKQIGANKEELDRARLLDAPGGS